MIVAGGGSSHPIADNSTTEGSARNRRVELYIDVPGVRWDAASLMSMPKPLNLAGGTPQ